jgi:phosphotriesterase-related protein
MAKRTTSKKLSSRKIPNMAGKAVTVKGVIDPSKLGATIMHEHIFIDFWHDKKPAFNAPATEACHWDEKLTLENLHLARDRKPIKDNFLLTDLDLAIREVADFRHLGGDTVVDVTSIGLGRDPIALLKVANATGLNIVMGSNWYKKSFHPPYMDKLTAEEIAEENIKDLVEGVDDTGIRPGIIGEVGLDGNPITPNEEKLIRSAAWVSRATGAAISLHSGGFNWEKPKVARMFAEEGADLERVIFGHCNSYAAEVDLLLDLLNMGCYVQFDTLGRVNAAVARKPDPPGYNPKGPDVANDVLVSECIPRLIEEGFEDKILLSQDVCTKIQLKAYGGTGYSFVLEKFLPYLRSIGVSEKHIHKMMVENPKRVLTFVEPG